MKRFRVALCLLVVGLTILTGCATDLIYHGQQDQTKDSKSKCSVCHTNED